MCPLINEDGLVQIVARETEWMVAQRMGKLEEELHGSMSLSPFLMPILYDLHSAKGFGELADVLLAGHLMIGHFTSFGKLLDEKILPKAFGTDKLTASYRKGHPPLAESCFNEIDHLVRQAKGKPVLLSLKSSRWTIQLTAAMELNTAFARILKRHGNLFGKIVVGVASGTADALTDKYDILRGINRGKKHDVVDLTSDVEVLAGREFWSWLNGGEPATQEWLLKGVLKGLRAANCRGKCSDLLAAYKNAFTKQFAHQIDKQGNINWDKILTRING
jgi:hypothetical protein